MILLLSQVTHAKHRSPTKALSNLTSYNGSGNFSSRARVFLILFIYNLYPWLYASFIFLVEQKKEDKNVFGEWIDERNQFLTEPETEPAQFFFNQLTFVEGGKHYASILNILWRVGYEKGLTTIFENIEVIEITVLATCIMS